MFYILFSVFVVDFQYLNAKVCSVVETRQKVWYALKSMENHTMYSSAWQTPFPYETKKDPGKSSLGISTSESAFEYN